MRGGRIVSGAYAIDEAKDKFNKITDFGPPSAD